MKPEVLTVGLGYIGLPTSALIASNGTSVLGVDINIKIVNTINSGKIHIVEPELDKIVSETVKEGTFKASVKPMQANIYLIVVPTPFVENNKPDISYVKKATSGIIPILKDGDLFIIESTCPVGTTEKISELIFSARPELRDKVYVAYCPERVLPGNVMYELVNNDRVIGGINDQSTEKAINFYSKYVKGELFPTNARTAEMCKLVENSSRDVQIAFANELSMICDKANINVWELIDLANKHPRVNILKPGCGVGGHCIAVDPYFIVSDFPVESKIINAAREVNNFKALWSLEKVENLILNFEIKNKRKPNTAILGLTFKSDIDDLRESPADFIACQLHKKFGDHSMSFVEPNISKHSVLQLTDLESAIPNADIIVVLVGHKEFKNLDVKNHHQVINLTAPNK